ncbi:helix-turn-helix domain-containing protein [Agromyces sp. Marseille-P2726]|uniref:helix-turn-helix domain-containing protein n=1 Tax=Agromyces sp. Marseille-P2726 TaxID=2709132 RepID=UPI00156D9AF6|nr:helix-turn-helix transcriptional regulator [Agromyces sp. Marseille-P2726]
MGDVVEFSPPAGRRSRPLWRHVLGEVLRGERLEQERILTEVAAAAGVSPQYLSEIERGRKEPSSEILGSVAGALGLDLLDVVARVASRLGGSPVMLRHPLDLTGSAAGVVVVPPGGGSAMSSPTDAFLLVA